MTEPLSLHGALEGAFTLPRPGARLSVQSSTGCATATALAAIISMAKAQGRLVVVTAADAQDMLSYADDLAWLREDQSVCVLPDWETLPYDTMSPHEDLVSERLLTLWKILQPAGGGNRPDAVFVSAATAAQRLCPKSFIAGNTFFFRRGGSVCIDDLRHTLAESGYGFVEQVMAPGEFCVRGGIVDVFPMGEKQPFRLDLFDDEIESIRLFDPETQLSGASVEEIRILPGHEFPMDPQAREDFRMRWRERFAGNPAESSVYNDIGNGIASAGVEYYLPLFFSATASLADYLPEDTIVVTVGDVEAAINRYFRETSDRARFLSADRARPALPASDILDDSRAFFTHMQALARVSLSASEPMHPDCAFERNAVDPARALKAYLKSFALTNRRFLLTATSAGRAARISELLREGGVSVYDATSLNDFLASGAITGVAKSPLTQGFELSEPPLTVLSETELFHAKPVRRRTRLVQNQPRVEAIVRDISELKPGDPVVHVEHGIGRYMGLETMQLGDTQTEFLILQYAKDAKLYVPVRDLHLIGRYTGADAANAPLHALGRGDWEKAKRKAAAKVRDTAAELLNLYALRNARHGQSFTLKPSDYDAFCEGFPFEETPDQASAIRAVLSDMALERPMDRLVCGDVGFGKTEVALRAAFVAVMNGKQVALLCPTTLLAEQHTQTFRERFAAWPVRIAELSRFSSGKETTEALKALESGAADIAIGTHKLLSESVRFKDLGLVIVDEEHRFGVRQKEKLKRLRADVDILTLTATPIPRTLAMSLEGIRDFSVIATAPEKRLAIKTFVRRESDEMIREACVREFKRGGQVYFLHNEVETIGNRLERLQALLPEARIAVAHGQMAERELERIMRDFYRQKFNLLLCTTIIETGIDVPNANTILMHRADTFGLAQLHQLRGRVGRSHHQAYAYLMIPGPDAITKNAQKRLEAIQNLEELGSGFYLAMHDLEIRGAGEVLGEHQSGEMSEIGFDLYNQMLKSAVDALRKGREPELDNPLAAVTDINLHFPSFIPSDYVPDIASRLSFYKALATEHDSLALSRIEDGLIDRYGRLPEQARALLCVHQLRLDAERLGIRKIDARETVITFTFDAQPRFDPMHLIGMLKSDSSVSMSGPDRVRLSRATKTLKDRMRVLRTFINRLEGRK